MPKEKWLVDREKYNALADIRLEIYNKVDDVEIDRDAVELELADLNKDLKKFENADEKSLTIREREELAKLKNNIEFSKKKIEFCDSLSAERDKYFVNLDKCIGYRESICKNIELSADEKKELFRLEKGIKETAPSFISKIESYKDIESQRAKTEREITKSFEEEREKAKIEAEKEYERRVKENAERRAALEKQQKAEKEEREANEIYGNIKDRLERKNLLNSIECSVIDKKFDESFSAEQKELFGKYAEKITAKREKEYSEIKAKRLSDEIQKSQSNFANINAHLDSFLEQNPSISARSDYFCKEIFNPLLSRHGYAKSVYDGKIERLTTDVLALKKLTKVHAEKQPGFFAKLFNTASNKAYKEEQHIIDNVSSLMKEVGFGKDFVDSLTDPTKKDEAVTSQTIANEFEKAYKIDTSAKERFDYITASELGRNKYQLLELQRERKDGFKEFSIQDQVNDKERITDFEFEVEKQTSLSEPSRKNEEFPPPSV